MTLLGLREGGAREEAADEPAKVTVPPASGGVMVEVMWLMDGDGTGTWPWWVIWKKLPHPQGEPGRPARLHVGQVPMTTEHPREVE